MNKNTDDNKVDTQSKNGQPAIILNDIDKLYFAVSQKTKQDLTFVYSLILRSVGGEQYELRPQTEIATFSDKKKATIYRKTIQEIIEIQKHKPIVEKFFSSLMAQEIKDFYQKVK